MKLNRTRAVLPALGALVLCAALTGAATAAATPEHAGQLPQSAPAQAVTEATDPELRAAIDAEIDAAIGSPAYTQLRALVNSGRLPRMAHVAIVRVLEQGAERVAPAAHACRRLLNARTVRDHPELAERCRQWLTSHDDGPLALATCRRVAQADVRQPGLATLLERCRALIAAHEHDDGSLRRICERLAASDAATGADDSLARRCRALGQRFERADLSQLAVCVRIARFTADHPELLERCRALLEAGTDEGETMRTLHAELSAVARDDVGAETEDAESIHNAGRLPLTESSATAGAR